jgi:large subunit ribosomal protein L5
MKKYLGKVKFNKLKKDLGYKNDFQVPKPTKIVVNMGIGERGKDKDHLKQLQEQLSLITGQYPSYRKAKQSVSAFDVNEGQIVGLMTTLRGKRMYDFLTKVVRIILPSWKNFKGVPRESVTDQGNLTIGLPDNVYFPEINYEQTKVLNGVSLTIVTSANDRDEAIQLLTALGLVFESQEARQARIETEKKRQEEREMLAEKRKAYKEMAKAGADEETEETASESEDEK